MKKRDGRVSSALEIQNAYHDLLLEAIIHPKVVCKGVRDDANPDSDDVAVAVGIR